MKKPRKHTRRGINFDALADGYQILNSPLAQTFRATAEHFDETDPPVYESKRPVETLCRPAQSYFEFAVA